MVVFVLVVWFGLGNTQTTFSVPAIANAQECERLGAVMKQRYGPTLAVAECYPYRMAK